MPLQIAAQDPQLHCEVGPPVVGVADHVGVAGLDSMTSNILVIVFMGFYVLRESGRAGECLGQAASVAAQVPQLHCEVGPPVVGVADHVGVAGLDSMTSNILVIVFMVGTLSFAACRPRAV